MNEQVAIAKEVVRPVDEEILFDEDEIIVSKTDLKGRIQYANDVFCRVAEMSTREVIGAPHKIIRHPDMPRAVFKLLWDTIQAGDEIFAYVKNMSSTGKYYWVIAHVTPSFGADGSVNGYHSNRRKPSLDAVSKVSALYADILAAEKSFRNGQQALAAGTEVLESALEASGMTYSEFVWSMGDANV